MQSCSRNDSLLWLGTTQGLYIYNLVSGGCKKITNLFDDNFPINFIIKKQEEFWLVGDTKIHVFDPQTKKPVNKNPLPGELIKTPLYITQVYVCRNGNIWMLTRNTDKLFYLRKGSDQWHSFEHRNNDPHSPRCACHRAYLKMQMALCGLAACKTA
jgi:hypothetical protein